MASGENTIARSPESYLMRVAIVVLLVLVPVYYVGYLRGYGAGVNATTAKYSPNISTYESQSHSDQNWAFLRSLISSCQSDCKAMGAAGVNLASGVCIYPNPAAADGYVCAVVVKNKGHCDAYYKGVPEIVLDPSCNYVGVAHQPSGENGGMQ